MGLRWKSYIVDHTKFDNMEPWYVKLNPKAYVPTMLVENNTPVCESIDIIKYMDDNLNKGRSLLKDQT